MGRMRGRVNGVPWSGLVRKSGMWRCPRLGVGIAVCRESSRLGYRLAAKLAAVRGERDLREALSAGLGGGGFGSLDPFEQAICRKHDEEVDDCGEQDKGNDGVDEIARR